MEIEKSIFFMLDSISRHNSKTLHVFRIFDFDLEPAQIFENVPSPVLAKSPTGIGQFVNRYWPNRQPVLAKSPTGIDQITNRYGPNRQPVLTKSPTRIGEIVYWSEYFFFQEISLKIPIDLQN